MERILKDKLSRNTVLPGSSDEEEVVLELRDLFKETGSDNVYLEPIETLYWGIRECFIEGQGFKIKCYPLPYTISIDVEAEVVCGEYIGDRIIFWENPRDKIVLIPYPRCVEAVSYIVYRLYREGVEAVVFYDNYPLRYRMGVVATDTCYSYSYGQPPVVPVATIRKEDAIALSKKTSSRARLYIETTTRLNSVGYNVLAECYGREDRVVEITTHHDHWFKGYSDSLAPLHVLLGLLEKLEKARHKYTYTIISFTSNKLGSPGYAGWYWIWGSRRHLLERMKRDTIDDVLIAINTCSLFTLEPRLSINPFLYKLAIELSKRIGFSIDRIELDNPFFDSFSYTLYGVPAMTIHTHPELSLNYNTDLDDGRECPENLVTEYVGKLYSIILTMEESSLDKIFCLECIHDFIDREIVLDRDVWPIGLRVLIQKTRELGSIKESIDVEAFVRLFTREFIKPVTSPTVIPCITTAIYPEILVANDIDYIMRMCKGVDTGYCRYIAGECRRLSCLYMDRERITRKEYLDTLTRSYLGVLEDTTYDILERLDKIISSTLK